MSEMPENIPNPFPDRHELSKLMDLLTVLHDYRDMASGYHDNLRDVALRNKQPLSPLSVVVETTSEDEHIPAGHLRIAFTPERGHKTVAGISLIVLRYPYGAEDFMPQAAEPVSRWNDVFMEVWDTEGIPQDYLVNSKGMIPFESVEDIVDSRDLGYSRDVFEVNATVPVISKFTSDDVYTALDPHSPDKYALFWQDKNTQPQPEL